MIRMILRPNTDENNGDHSHQPADRATLLGLPSLQGRDRPSPILSIADRQ